MIFRADNPEGELNGFVDAGSHFRGELQFETTFRVDGKVEGSVVSSGTLVVGEGGEVDGEVRVGQIFVSGTVRGSVQASRKIQLCAEGKIFADLETPSLVIEDGAIFDGRCAMSRERRAETTQTGSPSRPAPVPAIQPLPARKER
jgi:cytoskeletal protein CcmA (bactofilin family)